MSSSLPQRFGQKLWGFFSFHSSSKLLPIKHKNMHIYASSGFWKSSKRSRWRFLTDEEKRGRLLTLDTSKTFENLRVMVCEDFEIVINMVNIELSYLPSDLVIGITPPVFITKDRKLKNFLTYVKNKALTRLCVCIRYQGRF